MSNIFFPQDLLVHRITYYHLLLFVVLLPLEQFYSCLVLISFCLHTIIHGSKHNLGNLLRKEVLVLQVPFLITLACTAYSPYRASAANDLTKQLAVFLFPLLLLIHPIDLKKYTGHILAAFACSCVLCIAFLYVDAFRVLYYHGLPLKNLFSPLFINHYFSAPLGIHASYLSLYAALSLVYCLLAWQQARSVRNRAFILAAILILGAGLVQLASKSVLGALWVILLFFFPPLCLPRTQRIWFVALALFVSLSVAGLVLRSDTFHKRLVTELKSDLSGKASSISATNSRMERWQVAGQLVRRSPVIGYGSGTEKTLLREGYFESKLYHAYLHALNAHNQYLSFLIKGGIGALALFIYSLFFGFAQALRSRNILFISFLTLMTFLGFSENYLDVNKGIFFYGFFFSLFTCAELLDRKEDRRQKRSNLSRNLHVSTKNTAIAEPLNP